MLSLMVTWPPHVMKIMQLYHIASFNSAFPDDISLSLIHVHTAEPQSQKGLQTPAPLGAPCGSLLTGHLSPGLAGAVSMYKAAPTP